CNVCSRLVYSDIICIFFFVVLYCSILFILFFFFNDPATTEIYTLSLHDALPISLHGGVVVTWTQVYDPVGHWWLSTIIAESHQRSEEHTSELQSLAYLVCRLLLEKTKNKQSLYEKTRNNNHYDMHI